MRDELVVRDNAHTIDRLVVFEVFFWRATILAKSRRTEYLILTILSAGHSETFPARFDPTRVSSVPMQSITED